MSTLIDSFFKVAETISEALTGPAIPAVVEIGKDVINLIDNAKEVVSTQDAQRLQAIRDDLEPKVLAHADATEKELRGG